MKEPPWPTNQKTMAPREPTADEAEGIRWWNGLTEPERAKALADAGWVSGAAWTPSAADAWAFHKKKAHAANVLPFTKKPQT
jgi:hypothetical protein